MQQNAIPTNVESIPPWSLTELEKNLTKIIRITTVTQKVLISKQFSTAWIISSMNSIRV